MQPITIKKHKAKSKSSDFHLLKSIGVELLQKYCGKTWTDYNAHDPGITILEQLCFALSELSYRASFDIKDILASSTDGYDQAFFPPEDILPSTAVSISDFRKIIVDNIASVGDAWVTPLKQSNRQGKTDTVDGLYVVLIRLQNELYYKQVGKDSQAFHETEKQVKKEVWQLLDSKRLLCEDFEEIVVLKPKFLELNAQIQIEEFANPNDVVAEFFFEVERFLAPEMKFYSLKEAQDAGYRDHGLYEGPRTKKGFLPDSALKPNPNFVNATQLINRIKQLKGISAINTLRITDKSAKPSSEEALLSLHEVPLWSSNLIGTNEFHANGQRNKITFLQGNTAFNYRTGTIAKRISTLRKSHEQSHGDITTNTTFVPPSGKKRQLTRYFSLQELFPAIYGIGTHGIPGGGKSEEEKLRLAQAKQLKGYLTLFEQLLANYYEQLHQINTLFSVDSAVVRTYFFQSIEDAIPNAKQLKLLETDVEYDHANKEASALNDTLGARRNKFINHLLARFGENFRKFETTQFRGTQNKSSFNRQVLTNKVEYLRRFTILSRDKGMGFDYTRGVFVEEEEEEAGLAALLSSGVEKRISALLGIDYNSKQLMKTKMRRLGIDQTNIDELPVVDAIDFAENYSTVYYIPGQVHDEESHQEIIEDSILPLQILDSSYDITNLRIGPYSKSEQLNNISSGQEPTGKFHLVCRDMSKTAQNQWLRLPWEFDSIAKANSAAIQLAERVRKANKKLEGFHVLEHLLLRPERADYQFGLHYKNQEVGFQYETENNYAFNQLQTVHDFVIAYLQGEDFKLPDDKEEIKVRVKVDKKTTDSRIDTITLRFPGVKALSRREWNSLQDYITSAFDSSDIYSDNMKIKLRHFDESNEQFAMFSFTISVIVPGWLQRFNDPAFRDFVQSMFRANIPAHINVDYHYLSLDEYFLYEQLIGTWQVERSRPEHERDKPLVNSVSLQILELLFGKEKFNDSFRSNFR